MDAVDKRSKLFEPAGSKISKTTRAKESSFMWPFAPRPRPPVPQRLREMLKDYPDLIQRIQEGLNEVIAKPAKPHPPFEVAIWTLEDMLGGFISEAREELEIAEVSGDPVIIQKADKKVRLMLSARSSGGGLRDLSELDAYFDAYKGG